MTEIRIRDPRCGECPPPHPDMQFKKDTPGYKIWACPDCGFTYAQRKPKPPLRVIVVDEFTMPN